MKLLIVKLSSLGDIIQTLPSLTLLKEYLPQAKIDWVVDKRNAEVLENHPYINRLIIFTSSLNFSHLKDFLKALREDYYSAVIDYQGLLKSGVVTGLAKAKYKIGFSNHREGSPLFYNFKLPPYDLNMHAVKRYLLLTAKVLEILINKDIKIPEKIPQALFSSQILKGNFEFVKKPYLLFIPSARWQTKLWKYSHWETFIELCSDLADTFDIYITGSHHEKELKLWAERIEKKYPYIYSLVGKISLKELCVWIKNAKAVVSVDTGPMHIASAFKKPVVALFGPTSPERTGPWDGIYKVIKSPLSCSPCFKKKCKTCECMELIKPEKVKETLQELISSSL